jgi:WD40 repeat protein
MKTVIRTLMKAVRVLFVIMGVPTLMAACQGSGHDINPTLAPPGLYTEGLSNISPSEVGNLEELSKLSPDSDSGPVAGIYYQPTENLLLAVYVGNGYLRGWNLTSQKKLFEHDLNIVSAEGLGFDRSGSALIGATQHEIRDNGYGQLTEYVGSITIWNVQTGELKDCVVRPCEDYPALLHPSESPGYLGATLDPLGQWTISYDENVLSLNNLLTPMVAGVTQVMSNPDYNWRHVGRIAFDPTGTRFATAFQEGQIVIEKTSESGRSLFSPVIQLGKNQEGDLQKIPALSFASNNQWLARIRADQLSVWSIGTYKGSLYLEANVSGGKLLAFDQLSRLLIVGSNEKIIIWDIAGKSNLSEFSTPDITSLVISPDNRLLIWGDAFGIIHIWGIPLP